MFIRILGSSSDGNATLFHTDKHNECILFDCGTSYITKRIKGYNIIACFITHNHSDHCSRINGLPDGVKIFMSEDEAISDKMSKYNRELSVIVEGEWTKIGPYYIKAIPAEHDTPAPVHYFVTDGNESFFYGCDCCRLSNSLDDYFLQSDVIMLECDTDLCALRTDLVGDTSVKYVYDDDLKKRIASTHCTNEYIYWRMKWAVDAGKKVILGHLSNNYNSKDLCDSKVNKKEGNQFIIVDRTECPITIFE